MIGWEARPMNKEHWWKHVPNTTRHKLTFHNHPVTANEFERVLLTHARREDFVIVKLDIDNSVVEHEILERISKHSHLVDELFFEYHFWFDGLNFGWGSLEHLKYKHNVTSALKTMESLRKLGIRAHFWV